MCGGTGLPAVGTGGRSVDSSQGCVVLSKPTVADVPVALPGDKRTAEPSQIRSWRWKAQFSPANTNGQNVRLAPRQLKAKIRWSTGAGNASVGRERQNHDSRTKSAPNFWTLQLREWLQCLHRVFLELPLPQTPKLTYRKSTESSGNM